MYRNGRHRRDAFRTKDLRLRATCACDGIEESSEHSKGSEVKCASRERIISGAAGYVDRLLLTVAMLNGALPTAVNVTGVPSLPSSL